MLQHTLEFPSFCVPHFVYSFICPWILGFLPLLGFMNNTAINRGVQIFLRDTSFSYFGCILRNEIAVSHSDVFLFLVCLFFWGIAIYFSIAATSFYIFTHSVHEFQFFCILTNITLLSIFFSSHPNEMRWYLIVVLICISIMTSELQHFFVYSLAICLDFF